MRKGHSHHFISEGDRIDKCNVFLFYLIDKIIIIIIIININTNVS